jgi:acetylglutamate kinase
MEKQGIAVVAVGGNALIKDKARQSVQDQYECANDTMSHIVDMIEKGWDVVVSHGNGPQVGFILRARNGRACHCMKSRWITAALTPRAPSVICSRMPFKMNLNDAVWKNTLPHGHPDRR